MIEENKKLSNVKKSCKGAKIVSTIIFIVLLAGAVLCTICSILLFAGREKTDLEIKNAQASGYEMDVEFKAGPFVLGSFENGDFVAHEPIDSDIPAVDNFFKTNAESPSVYMGTSLFITAIMMLFSAFAFFLISSVFSIIVKEGNPFCKRVLKRTLVAMIILTVLVGFSAGIAFFVLMGFLTWVIYTVLDYGCVLQIQSDETL
ncbi:MAG: hypothetical protein J5856_02280 [Lachnospiraceae bacterium]|nr:hypothetical protein [Lachnospiraceae bacterium]